MTKLNRAAWTRLLTVGYIVGLALYVPYTKVEESFNMQAVHDILAHGTSLEAYDHLEFPGVVPRSFVGALVLAALSKPASLFLSGLALQRAVRAMLGGLLCLAYFQFECGVKARFGIRVATLTTLLLLVQFHLPFYMSRTLPNTFALAACLLSYSCWLRGRHSWALYIVGAAAVVFRCDLLVLLAPLALQFLFQGKVPFWRTLFTGVLTCGASLALSVAVDSFFWRHLVWPEGRVLFFNTVQNKSGEWGVYPWHWYLSSALPRSLHVLLPLVLVGVAGVSRPSPDAPYSSRPVFELGLWLKGRGVDWDLVEFLCPAALFIGLYGLLPHKELRFIFPALPLLTLCAARGLERLMPHPRPAPGPAGRPSSDAPAQQEALNGEQSKGAGKGKGMAFRWLVDSLANLSLLLLLLLGVVANTLFLASARHNYPGGEALQTLVHALLPAAAAAAAGGGAGGERQCKGAVRVHIGVDAAVSGVTRFGHAPFIPSSESGVGSEVHYSKEEGLGWDQLASFDWIITNANSSSAQGALALDGRFEAVETVFAFKRLVKKSPTPGPGPGDKQETRLVPLQLLPFGLELGPALVIARNRASCQ